MEFDFVAKRLPHYYVDGEMEGFALLLNGKKFGVVDRWRYGPDSKEWNVRINMNAYRLQCPRPFDNVQAALQAAKAKLLTFHKQDIIDYIAMTPDWKIEDEQP